MRLSPKQISELKTKFLGKKITFRDTNGVKHVGTSDFIGYNEFFPMWGLQITIDRTPITNVNHSTIQLYRDLTA